MGYFLQSMGLIFLIGLFHSLAIVRAEKLRPLVMIHGFISGYENMFDIKKWVEEDFPGMKAISIDAMNDEFSVVSLNVQVAWFAEVLKEITDKYGEVNLLGYSQGGLIARGVIEKSNNDKIHNFISLSAPGLGQFGIPYRNDTMLFDNVLSQEVYKICYRRMGQLISVCNYWNDPTERKSYLEESKFLPYLNNEVPHRDSKSYKENFARLNEVILVGGPDDDVIKPWESAQYSFYDENLNVIPFKQTDYYREDSFGLKSLDKEGRVKFCTMGGILHAGWIRTEEVYKRCIRPYIQ